MLWHIQKCRSIVDNQRGTQYLKLYPSHVSAKTVETRWEKNYKSSNFTLAESFPRSNKHFTHDGRNRCSKFYLVSIKLSPNHSWFSGAFWLPYLIGAIEIFSSPTPGLVHSGFLLYTALLIPRNVDKEQNQEGCKDAAFCKHTLRPQTWYER